MTGHESFAETTEAQTASTSPHAVPPLLSGFRGAVSGTPTA